MQRKCKQCKNSFPIKRINQYYCSQSCRQKAYLLRNGFSQENGGASDVNSNNLLKNITDSLNPDLLQGILSLVSDNPSLTDLLKPNSEKPNEIKEKQKEDSTKYVNDDKKKKVGIRADYLRKKRDSNTFMEKNNEFMRSKSAIIEEENESMQQKVSTMTDSCRQNAGSMAVACENHGVSMQKPCEKNANSMEVLYDNTSSITGNDTFSRMLKDKMTILIGKNGYVRGLFPNWTDKEWEYSLCINEELTEVLNVLYMASQKNKIATKVLVGCQETLKSISTGLQSYFLPKDYPFMLFIRYLKSKVTETVNRISDQKEIKFRLSEELREQMFILRLQLSE